MKVVFAILIWLCVFLLFAAVIFSTNVESESLSNFKIFTEGNGGDNGDPLPLPPNPPPPPGLV